MLSHENLLQWHNLDSEMMLQKVMHTPARAWTHWQRGLSNPFQPQPFQQIVVCGMGGSGSTGDFFAAICQQAEVPVWVHKTPLLPKWVGPQTWVIGVTYSGNTSETLACLEQAQAQGAQVALLTSGGQAQAEAKAQGWQSVLLDGGLPPRAALFDMLFALLGATQHLSVLGLQQAVLEQGLQSLG